MFIVEIDEVKPITYWENYRNDIDFNSPYHWRALLGLRDKRWPTGDKAFLIDSILNGYDIPKIYVADFCRGPSTLNPNRKMFAVIDGRQRLKAIFDFFDDKFALANDFVYQQNPELNLRGLHYSDLRRRHPQVCRDLDEFSLIVMSVVTDEEDKIRELFMRLAGLPAVSEESKA